MRGIRAVRCVFRNGFTLGSSSDRLLVVLRSETENIPASDWRGVNSNVRIKVPNR